MKNDTGLQIEEGVFGFEEGCLVWGEGNINMLGDMEFATCYRFFKGTLVRHQLFTSQSGSRIPDNTKELLINGVM